MTKFRKNTFIKWSDKDEQGTFSHVGQVVKHEDGMVIFTDKHGGECGVPEDEGKFKQVRKPKSWKAPAKNIGRTAVNKAVKKAKRVAGAPTKYEQVVAVFKSAQPRSRKEAIALVVEEVQMTPAGASTYVAKANKQLKLW